VLPVFVARVRELPPAETAGLAILRFQLRTRSSFRELNRQVFVTKRGARHLADHEQPFHNPGRVRVADKPGVACFSRHFAVSEDLRLRLAGRFRHKGQYRVVE
jgi:hypothetical protein